MPTFRNLIRSQLYYVRYRLLMSHVLGKQQAQAQAIHNLPLGIFQQSLNNSCWKEVLPNIVLFFDILWIFFLLDFSFFSSFVSYNSFISFARCTFYAWKWITNTFYEAAIHKSLLSLTLILCKLGNITSWTFFANLLVIKRTVLLIIH